MIAPPPVPTPCVAVVTGAASGIGAAVADLLRGSGWLVAGLDLSPSATDLPLIADVSDPRSVRQAADRWESELGTCAALVTAAGHYESAPVDEVTPEQFRRMLRVHLGGILNTSRAVLPGMYARKVGSIVAVTSELAIGGGDADSHYSAAKGAVIGLVRSLAAEAAPHSVRVNAVAPGPTDTPLLPQESPWRESGYLATLPTRRLTQPGEVAEVVRFLVEDGTFCTGEVISPNSGAVI